MVQGLKSREVTVQPMENASMNYGSSGQSGGLLSNQKDAKEANTEAKYGEIWNQVQAKFGAKVEKPREIKKTLGKDDFLRIMITQMKHQDPTQPFKAEQFASEMAQYASVEQLQNINQNLGKMSGQNQPMERLAMTGLIGKSVTVDRERFPHAEGSADSLSFALPKDASQVHVAIIAENGETAFQKDLGAQKAGNNSFTWDGIKSNTVPAKSGGYFFRITAQDPNGQSLPTNPIARTQVVGVSFEGAEPVFLVGDLNRPDKVTLRNIVKIESDSTQSPRLAQSQDQSGQNLPENTQTQALISFKKGVGSENLNLKAIPQEAKEAISKYQQSKQNLEEKGFPNGLHDNVSGDEVEKKEANSHD